MTAPEPPDKAHGVKITVEDYETGTTGEALVLDNYLLICHGTMFLDSKTEYHNGTTVLTLKRKASVQESVAEAEDPLTEKWADAVAQEDWDRARELAIARDRQRAAFRDSLEDELGGI